MTIRLSGNQLKRLTRTLDAAARPLDFETADQWREQVLKRMISLLDGQAGHLDIFGAGFRNPALFLGYSPEAATAWNVHWRHKDPVVALNAPMPSTYTRRWRYRRLGREWAEHYRNSDIFHEFYAHFALDGDASGLHMRTAALQMHLHIDQAGEWPEQDDIRARHLMRLVRPIISASARILMGHADGTASAGRLLDSLDCEVAVLDAVGRWLHCTPRLERTLATYESGCVASWRDRVSAAARDLLRPATRGGAMPERLTRHAALDLAGRRVSLVLSRRCDAYPSSVALLRVEHAEIPAGCPRALESAALTARQWEVTRLIAMGHSNQEISEALGTSVHTVRRHLEAILAKLDVRTRSSVAGVVWRAVR